MSNVYKFFVIYTSISVLILIHSFRYIKDLYSYSSFLILIPVIILISYINFKKQSLINKKLFYELLFVLLFSIIGFIFSDKSTALIKNYLYFLIIIYIYISIINNKLNNFIHFINYTAKFIINLTAICFIIWIFYFYIFVCQKNSLIFVHHALDIVIQNAFLHWIIDLCPVPYAARQFHYHIIFHSNLLNIILLFNLLKLFNNKKKFDKINFLSNSILCITSVSMIIVIIWFVLCGHHLIKKFISERKINLILILSLILTIISCFVLNEKMLYFYENSAVLKNIISRTNIVNEGDIYSITYRLERINSFISYFFSTLSYPFAEFFFGNTHIQESNFFHNSFFSIFHFYGSVIFLYILGCIFRLNNTLHIIIILAYFFTTDNLILHNFPITLLTWILMASLTYENKNLFHRSVK